MWLGGAVGDSLRDDKCPSLCVCVGWGGGEPGHSFYFCLLYRSVLVTVNGKRKKWNNRLLQHGSPLSPRGSRRNRPQRQGKLLHMSFFHVFHVVRGEMSSQVGLGHRTLIGMLWVNICFVSAPFLWYSLLGEFWYILFASILCLFVCAVSCVWGLEWRWIFVYLLFLHIFVCLNLVNDLQAAGGRKSALFSIDSVDSNIMLVWMSGKLSINFVAITFWSSYVCHEPLLWETCMSLVFRYMLFVYCQAFEPFPRVFEQGERLVNSECDCCVSKPFCSTSKP